MILTGSGCNPAIAWVREDLDETLDTVRDGLESFAEDRDRPEFLAMVRDQVERLHLTFQTMQQEGVGILTGEMLDVCRNMLEKPDAVSDDALNALTDAIVVLPAYLDRLQSGHEDLPVLLLPTLNELRATYDESLMSEGALFAPELDVIVPELSGCEADHVGENEIEAFARRTRGQYQGALLGWLKEQSRDELIEPMQQVCKTLHIRMARMDLRRLWWIAGQVMQGLRERAIDNDLPLRRLFARLDLTLKALVEGGEDGPAKDTLTALSRALLFYAAQARPGCTATDSLRECFRLEELIPDREALLRARGAVTGRDAGLFHSIGEAVREELAQVKDTLDMELRTGRVERTQRDASHKTLGHLADTLTMLDLPVAARAVEDLLPALESADDVSNTDLDSPLLGLAQKLLEVESVLNAHIRVLGEPIEEEEYRGFTGLPPQEQRLIFGAMLDECVASLHETQDAVRERLENREADVSSGIGLIAGAMEVAQQDEVAALATGLNGALRSVLDQPAGKDTPHLEPLTDAIAAMELFLVGCRDEQAGTERFLDVLRDRLSGLPGTGVEAFAPSTEEPASETPQQQETDKEPLTAPGIDDTMLEIFLEEFDQVHSNLEDQLLDWLDDVSDSKALGEVRRAFHTLKGSGRMVGATEIGDFAWRFEEMLNSLVEGKIEFSPLLGDVLTLATGALNGLRDRLVGEPGELTETGISALSDAARQLNKGGHADIQALMIALPSSLMALIKDEESPEAIPDTEAPSASTEPTPDSTEETGEERRANAILAAEARGLVETLAAFVTSLEENHGADWSEDVSRAMHTLSGSLATAPLGQEAQIARALEKHASAGLEQGARAGSEALPLLREALHRFRQRLYVLETGNEATYPLEDRRLIDAIEALTSGITEASEKAPEEPTAPAEDAVAVQERTEESAAAAEEPAADVPAEDTPDDRSITIEEGSIISIFLEEAGEVLERSDTLLNSWRDNLSDQKLVQNLQREIHTFKGGARMAGLEEMGEFAHAMETLFEQIAEGRVEATILAVQALEEGCDNLNLWVEKVQQGTLPSTAAALARFERRARALQGGADAQPEEFTAPAPTARVAPAPPVDDEPAVSKPVEPKPAEAETVLPKIPPKPKREIREIPDRPAAAPDESGAGAQIRVAADLMDKLVNYSGEVSIYRARLEQQIGSVRGNLKDVNATVARLKEQLRQLDMESEAQMMSRYQNASRKEDSEFDPLELDRFSTMQQLSRSLSESASDLLNLHEMLDESVRAAEALLTQQSRVSSDLQAGLMQTRMTPFGSAAPRLRRIVRSAAMETGKKARLQLRMAGTSDQLDRNVLERITAPLEHMLRNAIAHGIETPKARRKANKPEEGSITVTVEAEATEFVIRVQDDGAGVNLEAVRKRAIERGMLGTDEQIDPHQLVQFIRQSGFSTAEEVTGLAGRGVGMDVVNAEIKQIGGSLEISTEQGKGTLFTIRIPFSLAVMQAIGVSIGDRLFQVPLNSVAGVARLSPAEFSGLISDESPAYEFAGDTYPLLELEPLLGEDVEPLDSDSVSLLMISTGENRAAFRVNNLRSHQEVVIKPVGPQISSIPGILGGTIAADGQVMLILDMGPLIRRGLEIAALPSAAALEPAEKVKSRPTVMVVDDSITMRKVTRRVLENHSVDVTTAQDGVDAVEKLREEVPDLILLDIEMPRMDGYELLSHIRADAKLRHVPVVMVTSRAGQKHRRKAREAGANDYMTKPYQEPELIEKVSELLDVQLLPGRHD